MKRARTRTRGAAIVLTGLACAGARAAEWDWVGGCGGNQWYAVCTGGACAPGQIWHISNWMESPVCGSSGIAFPGPADTVHIDGVAYMDQQVAQILDLHISPTGDLTVRDGGHLTLSGTTAQVDGTLWVRWGGYYGNARLTIDNALSLDGTGSIRSDGGLIDGAGTLQIGQAQTIRGRGLTIDAAFDNRGVLTADEPGAITLGGSPKTNQGVLQAEAGGTLHIRTRVDQSATAKLRAEDGTVFLHAGAHLVGGWLESSNVSVCQLSQEPAILEDSSNSGKLRVDDGATLALVGSTFRNEGQLEVRWGGMYGNANLRLDTSPVHLTGAGEIVFAGGNLDGAGFEQAATHTIRGGNGVINAAGVNFGMINADAPGPLELRSTSLTNHGILKASPGGTLRIYAPIDQYGTEGNILADGGPVEFYDGAAVTGGTLDATGGATMSIAQQTLTLTDVVNAGTLRVSDGGVLALRGRLTNDESIDLVWGGMFGDAVVRFDADPVELDGFGTMSLAGARLTSLGGQTFHNTANHTIRGRGSIQAPFQNEGQIVADVPGNALRLEAPVTHNSGVLQAINGASLHVSNHLDQSTMGKLIADNGQLVLNHASELVGGTLETTGAGVTVLFQATSRLSGVTNLGRLTASDGSHLVVEDGLTNNGTIELHYGGYYGNAHFQLVDNLMIDGHGTLMLVAGDVIGPAGVVLHNGDGHTLTGAGPISVALINAGIVAPGNAIGGLAVNAAFTQMPTGVLKVDLAGPAAYDQLLVGGAANLGGAVRLNPVGGFVPKAGQQYTVLSAAGLNGAFSAVLAPGRYGVANVENHVVVTVLNGPGDLDCNGVISVGDIGPFVMALTNPMQYPTQFPNCEIDAADMNMDGAISVGDIAPFVALLTSG